MSGGASWVPCPHCARYYCTGGCNGTSWANLARMAVEAVEGYPGPEHEPGCLYVIHKASRAYSPAPSDSGYQGPTAKVAGVEPGKVYATRGEAEQDAAKLRAWNRCGFVVVEVEDKQ